MQHAKIYKDYRVKSMWMLIILYFGSRNLSTDPYSKQENRLYTVGILFLISLHSFAILLSTNNQTVWRGIFWQPNIIIAHCTLQYTTSGHQGMNFFFVTVRFKQFFPLRTKTTTKKSWREAQTLCVVVTFWELRISDTAKVLVNLLKEEEERRLSQKPCVFWLQLDWMIIITVICQYSLGNNKKALCKWNIWEK